MLSAALAVSCAYLSGFALGHQGQAAAGRTGASAATPSNASSSCHLANGIEHVVYLQLENVHFSRDLATVPSDLEQLPHLLDFLQAGGALLPDSHAPLLSGPGDGSLTSLTGLYPDHDGQAAGDSWRYFNVDGSTSSGSSSTYWSSPVSDTRLSAAAGPTYNLVTTGGRNVPAPWPAFTRAGCDVGSVGGPDNLVLRNTGSDLATVFGAGSREAAEARVSAARAAADFTGLAIHCAGQSAACRGGTARPDRLPDEPGGYSGFNALFGQRYVGSRLGVPGDLKDLAGHPIAGFPGFDGLTPAVSLAYLAAMQEHGVPVTYGYIADPHQPAGGGAPLAPGEPAYERQLHDYDQAFATFLGRLQRDGLSPANTLFVVSAGDAGRFVGSAPTPAGCDGVSLPCQYAATGAVQVDLPGMLAAQTAPSKFTAQDGSAPAVWVSGDPDATAPQIRGLERAVAGLRVRDPYTGAGQPLLGYLADRSEMRLLHMVTADQARTPSFVVFAHPGYVLSGVPAACPATGCTAVDPAQPYAEGGAGPGGSTGWLALAGPGVAHRRLDGTVWADEADVRPTLMALTGLRDGYAHDGRVLSEALQPEALPLGIAASEVSYEAVAGRLKQLDAPAGRVGMLSLAVATRAAASSSPGDADYVSYATRLDGFTKRRDAVADSMRTALEEAAFGGPALDSKTASPLTEAADQLLAEMARA
jgi:hypothetical protein